MRKAFTTIALAGMLTGQQQTDQPFTFKTQSNLVIVNVFVKDKDGKPIEGLKKSDFTLAENGKSQKIAVFDFERLDPPPTAPSGIPAAPAPVKLVERTQPQAAPVPPPPPASSDGVNFKYRDRRLIVMLFDFSSMPQEDQVRAQDGAVKFLSERMTPADLVAIMTFSTELKLVQDFTDDRDALTDTIKKFRAGVTSDLAAEGTTAEDTADDDDTNTDYVADETEFNIFNTDRKLSALESAAKMLGGFPEKKALVYFSSGVGKTGVENQSQLRSTVNAAVRSNVAFYPIDVRGLMAIPPGGDAASSSPRGSGLYSGNSQRKQRDSFNNQQETVFTLAADTGGKALLDNNDLGMGIVQAQRDIQSYYILGYYTTNGTLDGKFRRVEVKLASNIQAKIDYRTGYFASKEWKAFNSSDKERQLEEALMLGDPTTDLTLALEINYFRINRDSYFIPVAVKIPGSEIPLAKKGNSETTVFDFIGQVRDQKNKTVGSVRDEVRVKLQQEDAAKLARKSLLYDTGFTLPPGDYVLKLLVRENQTGKMGTFETKFTVPNLAAQDTFLRMSSVVWANQREPLSAAVGSVGTQKKLLANHPLVREGEKLIPSITHVFRRDQNMFVYFEVYDPAVKPEEKKPNVSASLTFYQGHVKAFESEPVRLTDLSGSRLPVQFQLALARLKPGKYTCQVNVVDELGRKFGYQRAPLVLLP